MPVPSAVKDAGLTTRIFNGHKWPCPDTLKGVLPGFAAGFGRGVGEHLLPLPSKF